MNYKYFAIDFDGTIVDKVTLELKPHAVRVIQRIKDQGGEVVIWTCRTDKDLDKAISILRQNNLPFDCINDTLPSVKAEWGENGRKIWAEVYIDDLSIHCRNGIDWLDIKKWIWGDEMTYDLMLEYDKVATAHFEEKKRYDLIVKREREKEKPDSNITEESKKLSKSHQLEFEQYDKLAYDEMEGLNISALYMDQVSKEKTRALRSVRYYHYRNWHKATLAEKERWGIDLVKLALQRSVNPVVSCSFGIDSIVTLYITRKALVELGRDPSDIQVIWNDTLNEFPEVRIFANQLRKDWNLNLLISKPKIPLKKVIEKHGGVDSSYFFTRKGDRRNGQPLSEKCCGTLKHEPMKRSIKENNWDLVLNGLRSDESTQRLRAGLRDGEYFYSSAEWKAFTCRPIMWMKEEDIWDYVKQENIPYNELYNKNTIMKYPEDNQEIIHKNENKLIEYEIDIDLLRQEQLLNVSRKQSILLKKLGYDIFTPRTGWKAAV